MDHLPSSDSDSDLSLFFFVHDLFSLIEVAPPVSEFKGDPLSSDSDSTLIFFFFEDLGDFMKLAPPMSEFKCPLFPRGRPALRGTPGRRSST